jgi:hypothetical protein
MRNDFTEWLFRSALYSLILFVVLVWATSFVMITLPIKDSLLGLAQQPLSKDLHRAYLQRLVNSNRLEDAKKELVYLQLIGLKMPEEKKEYEKRYATYMSTVDSYAEWTRRLKEYPNYRDGLYLLAQKSYILFDNEQTKRYLEESISLDPQFEQGKDVLKKVQ